MLAWMMDIVSSGSPGLAIDANKVSLLDRCSLYSLIGWQSVRAYIDLNLLRVNKKPPRDFLGG